MQRKKTPHSKRKLVLLALLVLFLLGTGIFTATKLHHKPRTDQTAVASDRPVNSVDYSPSKPSDNAANENRKSSTNASPTLDSTSNPSSDSPVSFSVNITNASALNDSSLVHVGTLVKGTTDGSCTLTATQAGQSNVTKTSSIRQDVNYYDCGVFNIPFSDFPHTGNWTITLTVTSNGKQASNTWPDPINVPSN